MIPERLRATHKQAHISITSRTKDRYSYYLAINDDYLAPVYRVNRDL